MSIDRRRLICPSLTRPMSTGDGCLARLAPLNAPLDADTLYHLASASCTWGNGVLEVTRRGNLQCRGFPCREDDAFRPILGALPGQSGSRFPISLDPIGLLNPATAALMQTLYAGLHEQLRLSGLESHVAPKISLVISAGGGVGHDTLATDIQLHLEPSATGCRIHIGLGRSLTPGDMRWQGATDQPTHAIKAVTMLLWAIGNEGPLVRAKGLPDAAIPNLPLNEASPPASVAHAIGDVLEEPAARLWGVPCGRLDSTVVTALGDICARLNVTLWPIPERRLLIVGAHVRDADHALRSLGLIEDPSQPLPYIDLCAGRDCPRGGIDTHAIARRLAALLTALPAPISAHVSGCPKRCARDIPALLTISGDDRDDMIRVVIEGQPGDAAQIESNDVDAVWRRLIQLVERVKRCPAEATNAAHWNACWQALCRERPEETCA